MQQTNQHSRERCHQHGCITPPVSVSLMQGRWLPACPQHGGAPPRVQLGAQQSQQPSAPACVPPLPAGEVTLGQAKAHLVRHMPGFERMGWDAQFHACRRLRQLCAGPTAAQLAKQPARTPTLLLALYTGETQSERARAYLSATVDGWDKMPYLDQWERARELLRTHNVVDVGAEEAP